MRSMHVGRYTSAEPVETMSERENEHADGNAEPKPPHKKAPSFKRSLIRFAKASVHWVRRYPVPATILAGVGGVGLTVMVNAVSNHPRAPYIGAFILWIVAGVFLFAVAYLVDAG